MFKSFIWDFSGRFFGQIIAFVFSIFLTRLLSPAEFGILGYATVIISFATYLLDMGFSRALIQQHQVSLVQYSTIFYINLSISLIFTVICFLLAVPIAVFYDQPLLVPIFRVLSFSFLFSGLNLIPTSIIYKKMNFKIITLFNLTSNISGGIIGIILAIQGKGVWSLVFQTFTVSFISLLLNLFYIRWIPALQFNLSSIRHLWKFGSRIFTAGLLDVLFTRGELFIIGKVYNADTLGYYTRAQSLDQLVRNFSSGSILNVLYPFIAKNQNDRTLLKTLYYKYLHYILFLSCSISGLLFLVAKPLFIFLFSEKWAFSGVLFQYLSVIGFIWPVSALVVNLIEGVGNSKLFMKLELIKKLMLLPVFIFGFLGGVTTYLKFYIVALIGMFIINIIFITKEFSLNIGKQFRIIFTYLIIMFLTIFFNYYAVGYFPTLFIFMNLLLRIIFYLSIYIIFCAVFKLEGLQILILSYRKFRSFIFNKTID